MSVRAGEEVEVTIEKPAAGGRMLARHDGQVLFVAGAIPGERVRARVERVDRQLAFAQLLDVLDPSPDRRPAGRDPACGGCVYAHIGYPRQLALKAAMVEDAFTRLARLPPGAPVSVRASPERAYRMRARFHVEGDRVGFYREGTHALCDARDTGHLREEAVDGVHAAVRSLMGAGCRVSTALLAENLEADQRVLHVESPDDAGPAGGVIDHACRAGGLSGCSVRDRSGSVAASGIPSVGDPLEALTGGRASAGTLHRRPESFFQANRFLLPALVGSVLDAVPAEGDVLDLYAGVGLFSVSLAAAGRGHVTAVEGDRSSGSDLRRNAAQTDGRVRVVLGSVETHLERARVRRDTTVIVDPPRTGISRAAMQAVAALGARRVVYVSCDPATMARDARRLVDAGYRMTSLEGFDLFPNTPHVEARGIFDR